MAQGDADNLDGRWFLLVAVMAGTFMVVLDNIVINLAIPYIMTAFGTNLEHAKWVSIAFMLSATVAMPVSNWLAQRLGYSRVYLASLAVFSCGAALCALSWSLDTLIAARVLQGIGAGLVQPLGIAILTRAFPPEMRGVSFGFYSTGVTLAPIIGPLSAGFLIDTFTWRAIFTMSLMVSGGVFFLAAAALGNEEDAPSAKPFDWRGYLPLSVFLISTLLTLSNGQLEGWDSRPILIGWAVAAVAGMLFLAMEWGAESPIVPLRLFRIPDFTFSMILTSYKALARAGAGFLLPIFMQRVQGRESFQIGLLLLPGALTNTFFNPVTGFLTDRFGGRWLTVIGTLAIVYYLYMYSALDFSSGVWFLMLPQIFRGIGISLINTPVMTVGLNSVTREDAGNASWLLNMAMRIGGTASITMLSSLLHRQTVIQQHHLGGSRLATTPLSPALVQQAIVTGLTSTDARSAVRAAMTRTLGRAANVRAYQNLFLMCGMAMLTSIVPAFFLTAFPAAPIPRVPESAPASGD